MQIESLESFGKLKIFFPNGQQENQFTVKYSQLTRRSYNFALFPHVHPPFLTVSGIMTVHSTATGKPVLVDFWRPARKLWMKAESQFVSLPSTSYELIWHKHSSRLAVTRYSLSVFITSPLHKSSKLKNEFRKCRTSLCVRGVGVSPVHVAFVGAPISH